MPRWARPAINNAQPCLSSRSPASQSLGFAAEVLAQRLTIRCQGSCAAPASLFASGSLCRSSPVLASPSRALSHLGPRDSSAGSRLTFPPCSGSSSALDSLALPLRWVHDSQDLSHCPLYWQLAHRIEQVLRPVLWASAFTMGTRCAARGRHVPHERSVLLRP